MDYKTADRLVELRKRKGCSQEELADKLAVSRQAISNWERAEALPDTENLIALARLYGITLDELVHGEKPKPVQTSAAQHGKLKPTHGSNMKPVRSLFVVTRLVHLILGASLLGVGALLLGLSFAINNATATLVLLIVGGSIAFSGLVEAILGFVFHIVVKRGARRLARLKDEGLKFQVDSIEVRRAPGVRTMNLITVVLECAYTNHEGKTCFARSGLFIMNVSEIQRALLTAFIELRWTRVITRKNSQYNAFVYVNRQDPTDYAVEVFGSGSADNSL